MPRVTMPPRLWLVAGVLALACAAVVASLSIGATGAGLGSWLLLAGGGAVSEQTRLVLLEIRLPRTVLGVLAGASLASAGAIMQGLFRNPLADPALIGVSPGAALAVVALIALGDGPLAPVIHLLGQWALPAAALAGGLSATLLLYTVATREGMTSIATLLLAGIALAAFAGAGTGLLIYAANDRQLRDLTFWSLGSLSGATWPGIAAALPFFAVPFALLPFLARPLNALLLGEAEAWHLGVAVERVKRLAMLAVACAVATSVSLTGVIGFIGVVVPHLIRLAAGPDHRLLLPASALLGAALLVGADVLARIVVAPAELPIGIVTALLGAPFFLWLLLRARPEAV
ncbi:FecCD family ABC transporter permease [Rhodopila sp.]|uniref:FecCD family ABC transporter permease n=1 Tax=Rhodopila sp. TaxID=2480087 RepID=UPI002D801C3A|nr:iron chelate uptake ABC transporter family permease subunit [Rhodopila sp.]